MGVQENAAPTHQPEESIRKYAITLLAVAQSGLTYANDVFDRERYNSVQEIAIDLMALVSSDDSADLRKIVLADSGHATPKVDVRAGIFNEDGRILLVRERCDGLWTLPGGWCDVLESPSDAVRREAREEAGVSVEVTKLVAVLDTERQGHWPPRPFHIYKLLFLCRELSRGRPDPTEILDVDWFSLDRLPPLSAARVRESQLQLLQLHWKNRSLETVFD